MRMFYHDANNALMMHFTYHHLGILGLSVDNLIAVHTPCRPLNSVWITLRKHLHPFPQAGTYWKYLQYYIKLFHIPVSSHNIDDGGKYVSDWQHFWTSLGHTTALDHLGHYFAKHLSSHGNDITVSSHFLKSRSTQSRITSEKIIILWRPY